MSRRRKRVKVFYISGWVGLAASLLIISFGPRAIAGPCLDLLAAPAAMLGFRLADALSPIATMACLAITLVANYLLYGFAGLLLYRAWAFFRSRMGER